MPLFCKDCLHSFHPDPSDVALGVDDTFLRCARVDPAVDLVTGISKPKFCETARINPVCGFDALLFQPKNAATEGM